MVLMSTELTHFYYGRSYSHCRDLIIELYTCIGRATRAQVVNWLVRRLQISQRNPQEKAVRRGCFVNMEGAEDRMIELHVIVTPYPLKDVYNIDKTGLF